ncbi:MAG: SRPBCC family protein [Flavisolibacter sp.]|jgi:ligand-binding SRPBCC domain-containing protein|nr:SRPBCC family protein [Flavisolibacter sp.]
MGKLHYLKSIQHLPASIETCWEYFSDPRNLLSITPPSLNLVLTSQIFGHSVYPGQVMTYKVKPFPAISFEWMTEITHIEAPYRFVDEQRKGPYKLWHHQHHFKQIDGGVEMTDLVHYRLPLGFLGNIAHPFLVKSKLKEIFLYRYQKIEERFGAWQGKEFHLEIK